MLCIVPLFEKFTFRAFPSRTLSKMGDSSILYLYRCLNSSAKNTCNIHKSLKATASKIILVVYLCPDVCFCSLGDNFSSFSACNWYYPSRLRSLEACLHVRDVKCHMGFPSSSTLVQIERLRTFSTNRRMHSLSVLATIMRYSSTT